MSTVSTKQRNLRKAKNGRRAESKVALKKSLPLPAGAVARPVPVSETTRNSKEASEVSARVWLIASFAIIAIAAFIRLYALELKPMHHDEGVNGFFITNLVRQGVYRYDPTNFHGPALYYLTLPSLALFGLNTFAVRFAVALFGVATVWLILKLRRYIGYYGALAAALLVALSPGAVYYSRYFIHETMFVFFTLGIVVAALRFYETGRAKFVALGATSLALLFATKETAFVSVGTIALAWLVARFWANRAERNRGTSGSNIRSRGFKQRGIDQGEFRALMKRIGGKRKALNLVWAALALFVFANILLYSSFFSNWNGVSGAIESFKIWSKTGTSDFHGKPFSTYLGWLVQEETPILLLGLAGSLVALFGSRISRFAIFCGAWGFGIFLAYSLIPYKTPWLMLSFVVPWAIAGGYAVQVLADWTVLGAYARRGAVTVTLLACFVCAYQSVVLNFRQYDNDAYPYVYAHTSREVLALVSEVERIAERAGEKQIGVSIASPEHWPLSWHFRNNPRVGFAGNVSERYDPKDTPLVVGKQSDDRNEDQAEKLRAILGADYAQVGVYTLRPGVRLVLFARQDLVR